MLCVFLTMGISIQTIITSLLLCLLIVISYMGGTVIQDNGKDTVDFCKQHYRNQSFLNTMIGDEPAEVKVCDSSKWRTGWYGYCNSTCSDNVDKCLEENATDEQIRFSRSCAWMSDDYLILFGTLVFKYFFPIFTIGGIIFILYSKWKEK